MIPPFSIRFTPFGRLLQKNPANAATRDGKSEGLESCRKDNVGVTGAPWDAEIFAIQRSVKRQELFRIEFGDPAARRIITGLNPDVIHAIL
jgi:hypothetical protein